jgi:tetratricopeptide (TPR) repeat protein
VLAEALYRLGRTSYFLDRPDAARAALDDALIIADESGHDEIRARALVARFQVSVYFSSDAEASRALARRARAATRRWDGDPALMARIENGLGQLALEEARTDDAIDHFERALAIYEQSREGLEVATARQRISGVLLLEREVDRAIELKRSALAIKRRDLGDEHPDTAWAYEQLGVALRMAGDYEGARDQLARARAFWDSPRGREALAHLRAASAAQTGTRAIRGVVLDAGGAPVAGAEVVAGELMQGDGLYMYASRGGHAEASSGLVRTMTGADGRFELADARADRILIGAERPDTGRSMVRALAPGGDVADVELRLRPYGEVAGRVDTSADPFDVGVAAMPASLEGGGYAASVAIGEDGRYRIRLPAGKHRLYAGTGEPFRASQLVSKPVTVRAGETTDVDWTIEETGVAVELVVRGEQGAPLDSAQVFLFDRPVSVTSGAELNKLFAAISADGTSQTGFVRQVRGPDGELEHRLELDHVRPGTKSLCILPITGELKDPRFTRRLQAHADELDVHCRRLRLPAEPERQRIVVEVPPMRPLPEPVIRD